MSIQALFNWKERGSYLLILVLLIVLMAITMYLSDLKMKRIHREIPKIGELISTVPDLHPTVFYNHTTSKIY